MSNTERKCLNDIGKHCVGYMDCSPTSCTQLRTHEHEQRIDCICASLPEPPNEQCPVHWNACPECGLLDMAGIEIAYADDVFSFECCSCGTLYDAEKPKGVKL